MQIAKKVAVLLGVSGEDPKNLDAFCTLLCWYLLKACFAVEIVKGVLRLKFMQERCLGTSVCGPTLKEKLLASHQKISTWLYICL